MKLAISLVYTNSLKSDRLLAGLARLAARLAAALWLGASAGAGAFELPQKGEALRVASFNVALARRGAGVLIADFGRDDPQIANVVEIILRVRPDILLLNELDADPEGRALALLVERLAAGTGALEGLAYPHSYQPAQNSGVFSGLDLDGDGERAGPRDAWGYGRFPGQYAMAVLSRFPIDADGARTYRRVRWAAMPGARRPVRPDGTPYHPDPVWQALRLSSKSHWDLPILLPEGGRLHLLAAHPTPPVFDGPEDRNGRRNADEIRLLTAMIEGPDWLRDDRGRPAGLAPGTFFVVAGDLNADPIDGDGRHAAIRALLGHPRLSDPRPVSVGAAEAGRAESMAKDGDPAHHTADWPEGPGKPGNLRVDYVLPSAGGTVLASGVFWPERGDPLYPLVDASGRELASSDHRLVWVDIGLETREETPQ